MKRLRKDRSLEHGVTAVEYTLVIGLVSLLIVGAAVNLGGSFGIYVDELVGAVSALLS